MNTKYTAAAAAAAAPNYMHRRRPAAYRLITTLKPPLACVLCCVFALLTYLQEMKEPLISHGGTASRKTYSALR